MSRAEELQAKLQGLWSVRHRVDAEISRVEREIASLGMEDYPTEEGWYEDGDQQICRLRYVDDQPIWDDGWGNYGAEYGFSLPVLPLTRLVPAVRENGEQQ